MAQIGTNVRILVVHSKHKNWQGLTVTFVLIFVISDNNNNNQNVNIQNSNNNQNNQNTVMAGRTIPLEEVLKLQERLASHYRQTESLEKNVTADLTVMRKVRWGDRVAEYQCN